MISFKQFLQEAKTSGADFEIGIVDAWNGVKNWSVKIDKKITREACERIVETLKKQGVTGKAERLGSDTIEVTKEWSKFWAPESVPASTKTPKTDIIIGKHKISLKAGEGSRLMSGSRNESRATLYAALSKTPKLQETLKEKLITSFEELVPSNITTGPVSNVLKAGTDEILLKANEINKKVSSVLTEVFNNNVNFSLAFIREAMSGEVKFGGNDGTATHILTVDWNGDVLSFSPINDSYVKSVRKHVQPAVSFKSHSRKAKKVKTGNYSYWSVVALMYQKGKEFIKEEMETANSKVITENIFASAWNKLMDFVKGLFSKVKSWLNGQEVKTIIEDFFDYEVEVYV